MDSSGSDLMICAKLRLENARSSVTSDRRDMVGGPLALGLQNGRRMPKKDLRAPE